MGQYSQPGCAGSLCGASGHHRSRIAELCARLDVASRGRTITGPSQDISTRYERIVIPALHIAGWFDTYLEGSIAGYLALRKHAGSEFARENQYLIAGPWVHIPWGDRAGDVNFGEAANLNTDEILLRWFNHWLKDSRRVRIGSRGFATLRWGRTTGAMRRSGRLRQSLRSICTARAMPIRARATGGCRQPLRRMKSRAMYLSTIRKCR